MSKLARLQAKRAGRVLGWLLNGCLAVLLLLGVAALALQGRAITAPGWVAERVETRMNAGLAPAAVDLGALTVALDGGLVPQIGIRDTVLRDGQGRGLVRIPEADVSLDRDTLFAGRVMPQLVRVSELEVGLRRNVDGQFDLSFGGADTGTSVAGNLAQVIDAIQAALAGPGVTALREIDIDAMRLVIDDRQADRLWEVPRGSMQLLREDGTTTLRLSLDMSGHFSEGARATLTVSADSAGPEAVIAATLSNMPAKDIATLGPTLSWLELLEAPVSGSARLDIDENGALGRVNAALDIGAGRAVIPDTRRNIAIDGGKAYFGFDPETATLSFDQVEIKTAEAQIAAEGTMLLRNFSADRKFELLGQFQFSEVVLAPLGIFEEPARFDKGAVDFRLRLAPFELDVGQFVLADDARRAFARGSGRVRDGVFLASIDATLDATDRDGLMALWPVQAVPKTRDWVSRNLLAAQISNAQAALRIAGDARPNLALSFDFQDTALRFLKHLPPVQDARGYGTIQDGVLTFVADTGRVRAPQGGDIDAGGTVFRVANIYQRPTDGEIRLQLRGPATALLSTLDRPPFEFLSKAGRPVDLLEGEAEVSALVTLPLIKRPARDQIVYEVQGQVRNVSSDKLVPNRVVRADALQVTATPKGMRVAGKAELDGVAFDGNWTQKFGPENRGKSRVVGAVALSQDVAQTFKIGLPPDMITGEGLGRVEVDLERDQPPRLRLFTDINGLGVSIPAIGWSKSRQRTGELEVLARLGPDVEVTDLRLDAPGLALRGTVRAPQGGPARVQFSRARVGNWFDGALRLTGGGPGSPPDVEVLSGRLDLRTARLGGRGTPRGALTVALDRVIVSDGIAVTGLRGNFPPGRGLRGDFQGRINGTAPLEGRLGPSEHGIAATLRSVDAGSVFRSARIMQNMRGGEMTLTLVPRAARATYDGTLEVKGAVVRDAPVMAELLSAVSVVGLLEQLNTGGISFPVIDARFVLSPGAVQVIRSSAQGPSLGLTMDGVYDTRAKRLEMQGVVSPVYILNALGQIVSRRGEGLFGFNYRLTGPAADPQVRVNPLSVLMPGIMRDIFRRPTPDVPSAEPDVSQ